MSEPVLSDADLARIRAVIDAANTRGPGGVPMVELVALSNAVGPDLGITIDLPASGSAGYPVVVVQRHAGTNAVQFDALSQREHEVAVLVTEGLRNREIAQRLGISLGTAKDHVHHILHKTGLPSRAAVAVAYALRR